MKRYNEINTETKLIGSNETMKKKKKITALHCERQVSFFFFKVERLLWMITFLNDDFILYLELFFYVIKIQSFLYEKLFLFLILSLVILLYRMHHSVYHQFIWQNVIKLKWLSIVFQYFNSVFLLFLFLARLFLIQFDHLCRFSESNKWFYTKM